MTEQPPIDPVAVAPEGAKKPRRARTPKLPAPPTVQQVETSVAAPTLAFFHDVNTRLRDNALAEKAEIEKTWAGMRTRWLELDTLISAVDAGSAVASGELSSSLPPDLEHPGGEDAMRQLASQLELQRQANLS